MVVLPSPRVKVPVTVRLSAIVTSEVVCPIVTAIPDDSVAIFKAQAAILIGTVCFGHDTGVVEDNVIDFANQGEGTATPSGSGDSEILTIDDSEYWEFRDINFGTGECTLDTSKYQSPTGLPVVKYKTAVTQIGLSSESWTVYTVPFTSSGWVKVRVEN